MNLIVFMYWIIHDSETMATNSRPFRSRMVAGIPDRCIIHSIALVVRGSNPTLGAWAERSTNRTKALHPAAHVGAYAWTIISCGSMLWQPAGNQQVLQRSHSGHQWSSDTCRGFCFVVAWTPFWCGWLPKKLRRVKQLSRNLVESSGVQWCSVESSGLPPAFWRSLA